MNKNIESTNIGALSFTWLMVDLCQDIIEGWDSAFNAGALMEHFIEGITPLRLWHINSEEKICTCCSSHLG